MGYQYVQDFSSELPRFAHERGFQSNQELGQIGEMPQRTHDVPETDALYLIRAASGWTKSTFQNLDGRCCVTEGLTEDNAKFITMLYVQRTEFCIERTSMKRLT